MTLPRAWAVAWFAVLAAWPGPTPHAAKATIEGVLSFIGGAPEILDCDSARKYVIGAMAPGPRLRLQERYGALSDGGRKPVIAEMAGEIRHTKAGSRLERPAVLHLKPGKCKRN